MTKHVRKPSPWFALEAIPGLLALEPDWKSLVGEAYPAFRSLCLHPSPLRPRTVRCPHGCGCDHHVLYRHDGSAAVAACQCDTPACPDIALTITHLVPLELNRTMLGNAICRAFGLQPREADLPPPNTFQIGSWSSTAIPVILTIQVQRPAFRRAVAELAALLRQPFLLFAPTSDFIDAPSKVILENHGAEFLALNSTVTLTDKATLIPKIAPDHVFSRFAPKSEHRKGEPPPTAKPKYALRKGLGVWKLTFDGKEADLKHERGLFYVAWLLQNPSSDPIHPIDLAAKIPEIYRNQLGLEKLTNPITGKSDVPSSHARIQQRSLSLDDAQTMRALLRKQKELEAILDSGEESEPVKAEALLELEAITQFQRQHGSRSKDSAQNVADTVRAAIRRLRDHLSKALDTQGHPHPVLHPFALHIQQHILAPSSLGFQKPQNAHTKAIPRGLIYNPPPGFV